MHDTALLIGRFEPVHSGHLALLQEALRQAPQVIVVVGSAWQPRSPKNPFTWQEREAMLREALPAPARARVQVLPLRDYYNEAVWVQARRGARRTRSGAMRTLHQRRRPAMRVHSAVVQSSGCTANSALAVSYSFR